MSTREEKIKELLKTPELFGIKKLYRYRSMKSSELHGIFTKKQIRLPRPIDFNDPFECRPQLSLIMSRLKRELLLRQGARKNIPAADKRTRNILIEQAKLRLMSHPDFYKETYEEFLSTTGLYCLSEIRDDILMWSHYSDGHRGLCIEFDAIHDAAFSERMLFGQAIKVIYSEERPVLNIFNIGEPEEYQKALLTKSTHWYYEKEWRIIKTPNEGGPGPKPFHPSSLTGVIFGALISPENKEMIMDWIRRYPTKIILYQAKINESRYQLNIEPI